MPQIQVAIRVRPQWDHEKAHARKKQVVTYTESTVFVENVGYEFNRVFGMEASQETVYESVSPLVKQFLEGYNVTVFAYGQTGTGKTFTIGNAMADVYHPERQGFIPRVVREIFEHSHGDLRVSFLELYNDELLDLLNQPSPEQKKANPQWEENKPVISILEDNSGAIHLTGATFVRVHSQHEVLGALLHGLSYRSTSQTELNVASSRSHAIFTIEQTRILENGAKVISKLHLVDLAGSESVKRTRSVGERLKESISINSELFALGNVIHALLEGTHVPYRDSKLTRLLKDSLGGQSYTLMVACVSPMDDDLHETLQTLRYAEKCKLVKTEPVIQISYESELHSLREEVKRLRSAVSEEHIKKLKEENALLKERAALHLDDEQSETSSVVSSSSIPLGRSMRSMRMQPSQDLLEQERTVQKLKSDLQVSQDQIQAYMKDLAAMRVKEQEHAILMERYEESIKELQQKMTLLEDTSSDTTVTMLLQSKVTDLQARNEHADEYIATLEQQLKKMNDLIPTPPPERRDVGTVDDVNEDELAALRAQIVQLNEALEEEIFNATRVLPEKEELGIQAEYSVSSMQTQVEVKQHDAFAQSDIVYKHQEMMAVTAMTAQEVQVSLATDHSKQVVALEAELEQLREALSTAVQEKIMAESAVQELASLLELEKREKEELKDAAQSHDELVKTKSTLQHVLHEKSILESVAEELASIVQNERDEKNDAKKSAEMVAAAQRDLEQARAELDALRAAHEEKISTRQLTDAASEDRVQSLRSKLSRYQLLTNEYEAKMEKLKGERDDAVKSKQAEAESMKQELAQQNEVIVKLRDDLVSKMNEIDGLHMRLESRTIDLENALHQVEELEEELEALRHETGDARTKLREYEVHVRSYETQLIHVNEEKQVLEGKYDQLMKEMQAQKQSFASVHAQMEALSVEASSAATMRSRLAEMNALYQTLQKREHELVALLDEKSVELEQMKESIRLKNNAEESMIERLERARSMADEYSAELTTHKTQVEVLQVQIVEKEVLLNASKEKESDLLKRIAAEQATKSELELKLVELQSSIDLLEKEKLNLLHEVQFAQDELSEMKNVKERSAQVEADKALAISEYEKKVRILEKELQDTKTRAYQMEVDLAAVKERFIGMELSLKNELEEARDQVHRSVEERLTEVGLLKEKLKKKEEEIATLQEQVQKFMNARSELDDANALLTEMSKLLEQEKEASRKHRSMIAEEQKEKDEKIMKLELALDIVRKEKEEQLRHLEEQLALVKKNEEEYQGYRSLSESKQKEVDQAQAMMDQVKEDCKRIQMEKIRLEAAANEAQRKLEKTIADRESELSGSRSQIASLEARLKEEVSVATASRNMEIESLKLELVEYRKEIKVLKENHQTLENVSRSASARDAESHRDLWKRLDEAEKFCREQTEEVDRLTKQLEEQQELVMNQKAAVSQNSLLEKHIEELKQERDAWLKKSNDEKLKFIDLQKESNDERNKYQREKEAFELTIKDLRSKIARLEQNDMSKELRMQSLDLESMESKSKNEQLKMELAEKEKQLQHVNSELLKLQDQLQSKVHEQTNRSLEHDEAYQLKHRETQELKNKVNVAVKEAEHFALKVKEMEKRMYEKEDTIRSLTEAKASAEKTLRDIESKHILLKERMLSRSDFAVQTEALKSFQSRDPDSEVVLMRQELRNVEKQRDMVRVQLEEVQLKLKKLELRVMREQGDDVETLRRQLSVYEMDIARLLDRLRVQRLNSEAKDDEIAKLRERIQDMTDNVSVSFDRFQRERRVKYDKSVIVHEVDEESPPSAINQDYVSLLRQKLQQQRQHIQELESEMNTLKAGESATSKRASVISVSVHDRDHQFDRETLPTALYSDLVAENVIDLDAVQTRRTRRYYNNE